ncbi:MAG TPA: TIM barrel protein [Thermoguttaceae bacterium]|nr:TIM barrel protein [Thermoguttaceae bacterium]
MKLTRRDMLKLGAGAVAASATGIYPAAARANAAAKRIPIGLQLYSVRHACTEDLPSVLEAVAKFGYEGVEYAGYYGRTAKELRKLQDDNGLKCCGTHTSLTTLSDDKFDETVEFNKTIGNKYLIVPSMPHAYIESLEALKETVALFDKLAEKAKAHGMVVGYHAHGGDFRDLDGTTSWEVLFDKTCKDVVMQMDVGNCIGGGGDPYALLKKYPGRSKTIHLKEHGGDAKAVVGEGDVDWKQVFEICESTGGTEWYIVEHERGVEGAVENVGRCLANLKKMGK